MAGEIYIADKPTLDSVKKDTSDIKSVINAMGNFPNTAKQFIKSMEVSVPGTNKTYSLFSITGKGYIDCITAKVSNSTDGYFEIVVDGIVLAKFKYQYNGTVLTHRGNIWVTYEESIPKITCIVPSGSNSLYMKKLTSGNDGTVEVTVLGDTSFITKDLCLVEYPIIFNNSFEIRFYTGSGSTPASYGCFGGVI